MLLPYIRHVALDHRSSQKTTPRCKRGGEGAGGQGSGTQSEQKKTKCRARAQITGQALSRWQAMVALWAHNKWQPLLKNAGDGHIMGADYVEIVFKGEKRWLCGAQKIWQSLLKKASDYHARLLRRPDEPTPLTSAISAMTSKMNGKRKKTRQRAPNTNSCRFGGN